MCFFVFCFSVFLSAQTFSDEINFISHLIDNSESRDAVFLLTKTKTKNSSQSDSLNYYFGWALYNMKKLDSSAFFFSKVSSESDFFFKAKFYEAFEYIYLGKYDAAQKILNTINPEGDLNKLKNFELAGIALLQRDYRKFDSLSVYFDSLYYPIKSEQENFIADVKKLREIKMKLPFLAGLLSALFPGMGKFYAGYKGQALSGMLPSVLLAAVAIENLLKAGLVSPQFIAFGTIFSVFYWGNIYGSAKSARTKYGEKFYEVDEDILLDLHLPLRRVFN